MTIRSMGLAAVALLALAGPADAQRKRITAPDWIERPAPEDFATHYPGVAATMEIEGAATIACGVNADGRLVGCDVTHEAPRNLGFGAAALAISGEFRMKPQTEDGVAVDGGEIRIPIRFVLPKIETPLASPPDAPEATLAQARRTVDAMGLVDRVLAENEKFRLRGSSEGVSPPVRVAAEEAVQRAWAARRGELRDAYARALASVFSEDEITALADFAVGRGKDFMEPDKITLAEQRRAYAGMMRAVREPAYAAFCAKMACPTAAELAGVWRPVEARDGRIDNPQWSRTPSDFVVNRAATAPAGSIGLTGAVRMTCKVEKEGKLGACVADEELPRGLGYGAAAVKLAEHYRLSPIQLEAGAVGRKVTVRVGFTPPPLGEAYIPPKPKSAAAEALALKLMAANESLTTTKRNIEVQVLGFESKKPDGVDQAAYDALIEAYRAGALRAAEIVAENQAKVWAAYRSEEELAAMTAMQASPGGKAMRERSGALDVALRKANGYVAMQVTADARAAFCKDRDCGTPAAAQPAAAKPEASTRKP